MLDTVVFETANQHQQYVTKKENAKKMPVALTFKKQNSEAKKEDSERTAAKFANFKKLEQMSVKLNQLC